MLRNLNGEIVALDRLAPFLTILLLLVTAKASARVKQSWPVMGTFAEVVVDADSEERAREGIEAVRDVFERVNRTMTVYRKDSDLTRVNRWAGFRSVSVDPWVADLVAKARRASMHTGGAFSIDVLAEGMARGLKPRHVNAVPPGGRDPLVNVSRVPPRVRLPSPASALDLGGIAKGYALDRAGEVLRERGLDRYLINLGRNISMGVAPRGSGGWPVKVRGEQEVRQLEGVTVSTSEQGVRSDTDHVVGTGGRSDPAKGLRTVVVARSGWVADMASTALLVDPSLRERLKRTYPEIVRVKVRWLKERR